MGTITKEFIDSVLNGNSNPTPIPQQPSNAVVPSSPQRPSMTNIETAQSIGRQALQDALAGRISNDAPFSYSVSGAEIPQLKPNTQNFSRLGYSANELRDIERAMSGQQIADAMRQNAYKDAVSPILGHSNRNISEDDQRKIDRIQKRVERLQRMGVDQRKIDAVRNQADAIYKTNGSTDEQNVNRFIDPNYKLTKYEQKEAKRIFDEYLESNPKAKDLYNAKDAAMSTVLSTRMTPEEAEEYARMVTLANKTSDMAAALYGATQSVPGVKSLADKSTQMYADATGADITGSNYSNQLAQTQKQSPVANFAGNTAYQLGTYAAFAPLVEGIPVVGRVAEKAGSFFKNPTVSNAVKNVVSGGAADMILDTIPNEIIPDILEGNIKDIPKDTLISQLINGLFNAGGEVAGTVFKKAFNDIPVLEKNVVDNVTQDINPLDLAKQNEAGIDDIVQSQKQATENLEQLSQQVPETPEPDINTVQDELNPLDMPISDFLEHAKKKPLLSYRLDEAEGKPFIDEGISQPKPQDIPQTGTPSMSSQEILDEARRQLKQAEINNIPIERRQELKQALLDHDYSQLSPDIAGHNEEWWRDSIQKGGDLLSSTKDLEGAEKEYFDDLFNERARHLEQTDSMINKLKRNGYSDDFINPYKPQVGKAHGEFAQSLKGTIDGSNLEKEVKKELKSYAPMLDDLLERAKNATTPEEIRDIYHDAALLYGRVEEGLKGTSSFYPDEQLKADIKAFDDLFRGKVINIPKEVKADLAEFGTKFEDWNNLIYFGTGDRNKRGVFRQGSGSGIDTIFDELNAASGGRLMSYVEGNPDLQATQLNAILAYARDLKSKPRDIEYPYEEGAALANWREQINNALAQANNKINAEKPITDSPVNIYPYQNVPPKKTMDDIPRPQNKDEDYLSTFRTHNEDMFNLTDDELNNEFFKTDNENFHFLKGDRAEDKVAATQKLDEDFDGTVNKLLNKSTSELFSPQEVDESFMAWNKMVEDARESGDFGDAANLMYRMTVDAHEKGAGLQAYAAWKAHSPAGVVLDANEAVRDMAVDRYGKQYVEEIDNIAKDVSEMSKSRQAIDDVIAEVQEALGDIGSVVDDVAGSFEPEPKKKGLLSMILDFFGEGEPFYDAVEDSLEKHGFSDDVINKILEEIDKGNITDAQTLKENLTRIVNEQNSSRLAQIAKNAKGKGYRNGINGIEQMDELLKSGQSTNPVVIRDILYQANKIPNLSPEAQGEIAKLASEMYDNGTDARARQQYINRINMILSQQQHWSIKDKVVEMMHLLMLSGTRTHSRNTLANMAMLPEQALSRKISAIGQNAYHLINPDFKPTQAFHVGKDARNLAKEAFESKGGAEAIIEGLKGKYTNEEARKIGANYMFGTSKGNIFSKANAGLKKLIPKLGDVETSIGNTVEKGLKKIGSDGAYGAMDSNISSLENYRQFLYGSLSGLEDNPFVKKNFEDRMASFIQAQGIKNLSEIPEEAFDLARAEAIQATFKDDNAVTELFKKIKNIPVIGETLLPFVKTPANILARSFDYSPIGIAKTLAGMVNKDSRFAKATIGEAIDDLAKGIGGTALGALAMYLYANDVITGSKTGDADIDNYAASQGWQPFSLSTKGLADFINSKLGTDYDLGDSYIDYSWVQPLSSDIIAAQGVYDELADGEKITNKNLDDIFKKARNTAGGYVDTLLDQSTMQNISDLFSSDYDDKGVGENLFDSVLQMPSRFTSGAINDITKLTDDTKREYYSKDKPVETVKNMVQSKLPVLSQKMPAKYDVFGNEMTRNQTEGEKWINTLVNPASTTHRSKDALYDFVDDINARATDNTYTPTKTPRSIELNSGEKMPLDNEQYSKLSKVAGDKRTEILKELQNNSQFKNLNADQQAKVLDEMEGVIMSTGYKAISGDAKITQANQKAYDAYTADKNQYYTDTMNSVIGKEVMQDSNISASSNFAKEIKADIANGDIKQAEQKVETAKSLQDLGLTKPHVSDVYWSVHQQLPSLTQEEFAKNFKAMDADGNQGLKQEEFLNYVNSHSLTEKQVKDLWLYAKGTSQKIPVLEDQTWKLKK